MCGTLFNMTDKEVNIGFRVPASLVAELDDCAELLGVSRSEVIRRAMAVYIWQTQVVRDDLRKGKGGAWRRIFGPPLAKTDDETDEIFAAAFRSLAARARREGGEAQPA